MKLFSFLFGLMVLSGSMRAQIKPDNTTNAPHTQTVAAQPYYPASVTLNYIRTWELQKPITDENLISSSLSPADASEQTQYMDGLGGLVQTVRRAFSPNDKDLIAPIFTDAFGRQSVSYLPYVASTSTGSFQINPFAGQAAFMQEKYSEQGEQFFYSATQFETSPLNRIQKTLAPGNSWVGSGRGKSFSYEISGANEVRLWKINTDPGSLPMATSFYNANQLTRMVVTDASGKKLVEYKNKEGQIILRKVQLADQTDVTLSTGWLCTYYVYDLFGRLRFVLPPEAVERVSASTIISTAIADELCFQYEFDHRGRIISKKNPGSAVNYVIYDDRNRPIFTQDGNMRAANRWMATIYDGLNRTILTGLMTYTGTREQLTAYAANAANLQGSSSISIQSKSAVANLSLSFRQPGLTHYDAIVNIEFNLGFESESTADFVAEIIAGTSSMTNYEVAGSPLPPGSTFIALTQAYYDNYSQTLNTYASAYGSRLEAGSSQYPEPVSSTASIITRGMSTGGRVWFMPDPADLSKGQWLQKVLYYDDKGRLVQSQSENDKGGNGVSCFRFDFADHLISSYLVHRNPASETNEVRVLSVMDYDAQGRLITIRKKINDQSELKTILQNEYDELGKLKVKHLGNGLQDLTFDYNIRGWLLSMNKDYVINGGTARFGQMLSYDVGFTKQQYDGNIAGTRWRSAGDGEARAYGFDYDAASRLLKADFTQYTGGNWDLSAGVDFSMKMGDGTDPASAYDANGNIKSMSHKGLILQSSDWIDQLTYTYRPASNQLQNVVDGKNAPDTRLGDFHTSVLHPQKTLKDQAASQSGSVDLTTISDYSYDDNGNMTADLNKDIAAVGSVAGIDYNYINLPVRINVQKQGGLKGIITYQYDAGGTKRRKVVTESNVTIDHNGTGYLTNVLTTTSYEDGFIYESKEYSNGALSALNTPDRLQFFSQEEGRIRPNNIMATPFTYDYFIKDHLGNTRMVITDEQRVDKYPVASLEANKVNLEKNYYQIDNSRIISAAEVDGLASYSNDNGIGNMPADADFEVTNSQRLYRLNGNSARTGLGITLKVMAGDHLDIFGRSYYKDNSNTDAADPNRPTMLMEILQGLLSASGAVANAGSHQPVTASELNALVPTTTGLSTLLTSEDNTGTASSKPNAYINYLFFDEQFRYVGGSFSAVGSSGTVKDHHADLQNIPVPKNGFVYIYCSNQSPVNVLFDNLQVMHTRGAELEETHYYPFGLTMAGLSHKAMLFGNPGNKGKFNGGTEFENKEFSDGSGLDLYATDFRSYDPQIGRFNQLDILSNEADSWSGYSFAYDNPIVFNDPLGLVADSLPKVAPNPVTNPNAPRGSFENPIPTCVDVIVGAARRFANNFYASDPILSWNPTIIHGKPSMQKSSNNNIVFVAPAATSVLPRLNPVGVVITVGVFTAYTAYVLYTSKTGHVNPTHYFSSPDNTIINRRWFIFDMTETAAPGNSLPPYPTDPTKPPGDGWEWRGRPGSTPGGKQGAWYNEETKQSLYPDLDHSGHGEHWDYKDPDGKWYRWYPNGTLEPK